VHYRDASSNQQICPGAIARAQRQAESMNENFSLIVMCLFLLGSLAFLAQQLTSYH
jgi:hypothetical protein